MNPKQFLQIGGVILILLGILGFLKPDLAGDFLSFDATENWAHISLGVVAIVLAPQSMGQMKKWIVVLIGLIAIIVGCLGFMVNNNPSPNFYGVANLENPVENVLHLVIGIWALVAAFRKS